MSIKHLYPTSTPALNLNPKSSRVADPRLSCVRNSIGTYVDPVSGLIKTAPANVARVDKDGLLIEESRTNKVQFSEDYNATGWVRSNVTSTPNSGIAPDGTNTASLVESTANAQTYLRYTVTTTGTAALSAFVKAGTSNFGYLYLNGVFTRFNLGLGVIGAGTGGNGSILNTSIEYMGNGWYRCTLTNNSTTNNDKQVFVSNPDGSLNGTPGGNILVWGVQIEEGDFPTSYIPTSGSTVQRLADQITLTNSGIFNPNEFTTINEPFGVAGGSDTLTIVGDGEIAKRTAVYSSHLTQEQANTLAGKDDEWWEWRVVGSPFGWRKRMTEGSIDVDWGDGSPIEGLPIDSSHDFIDGAGYHTVRLRLGTAPYIGFDYNTADFKLQVLSIGPIPASMQVYGFNLFNDYTNLKTVDFAGASFMSPSAYGNRGFDGMFGNCSSLLSIPDIKKDSSVTRVGGMFNGCNSLTRLPLFDTSNIGSFNAFAKNCYNLKEVPLYDTSSVSNLSEAFFSCTQLTSFPLLDTSGVTNFNQTWYNCVSLASFPKIDTSSGTNFYRSWCLCTSLVSFPELDFSSGTTFRQAWYQDSALTDFPANMFNTTGTLAANAFQDAWRNCALTAQSIENILVSLDNNGATGIQLGIYGGSNAAKTTWSTAANDAYTNLVTKSWSISFNP